MGKLIDDLFKDYVPSTDEIKEKNKRLMVKYVGDADYGLVESKPIFVDGEKGAEKYLDNLSYDDNKIEYKLADTIENDKTGRIDIYSISCNGQDICRLFFNTFCEENSDQAPHGFSLSSVYKKSVKSKYVLIREDQEAFVERPGAGVIIITVLLFLLAINSGLALLNVLAFAAYIGIDPVAYLIIPVFVLAVVNIILFFKRSTAVYVLYPIMAALYIVYYGYFNGSAALFAGIIIYGIIILYLFLSKRCRVYFGQTDYKFAKGRSDK